jgi:hypothetical protein
MKVLLSPQVNDKIKIFYTFSGEVVTATIDGASDVFDFTPTADGIAVDIQTSLPFNPIINAERTDGILSVELLNFISSDATQKEKFPEWIEV